MVWPIFLPRRYKGFKKGQNNNSSRIFIRKFNTCEKVPFSVQDKMVEGVIKILNFFSDAYFNSRLRD